MSTPFFQAFVEIITLFEELESNHNLPYMLIGGILTPIYAESRQTQDVDVLAHIQVNENNKNVLINTFEKLKFQPVLSWRDTFLDWKSLKYIQFFDRTGLVKIDLILLDPSYKGKNIREKMKILTFYNRVRISIQGTDCWATSKEDFILSKLVYGGYQDYKDALACWIRYNQELDTKYLERNAINLQIEQEFKYILQMIPADKAFPGE